jgi:hypothetical protein
VDIVFSFAPYIAFFVALKLVAVELALWAAASVALLITGRNWARGASVKVLEAGSVVVFTAVAAFTSVEHWHWSLMGVRLAVDCGLLAIVLASIAVDRPFTLQYARERVPENVWNSPLFLSINRRITWVWAAAFAALVAAHAAVVFVPGTPVYLDIVVTVLALLGAFRFTERYPEAVRRRAMAAVDVKPNGET